jgi:hypothetical protein
MGAISSLNLLKNYIGIDQAKDLVGILKEHPTLKTLCGNKGNETELNMSGKMLGAGDAIMLVPDIIDNGALTALDLSMNRLGGTFEYYRDDGSGFGDFTATPEGPKAIADAIKDMGALTSLNFADNNLGGLVPSEGWTKTGDGLFNPVVFKHADGREQNQDPGSKPEGIIAIANAIPDMGALTSLHVGKNNIPEKEMREIMEITMRMGSMKFLCGVPFKDKTLTELDVSGTSLGTEGALIVAEYLGDNGALAKLDISNTNIEQGEPLRFITELCNTKGVELDNHESESESDDDY